MDSQEQLASLSRKTRKSLFITITKERNRLGKCSEQRDMQRRILRLEIAEEADRVASDQTVYVRAGAQEKVEYLNRATVVEAAVELGEAAELLFTEKRRNPAVFLKANRSNSLDLLLIDSFFHWNGYEKQAHLYEGGAKMFTLNNLRDEMSSLLIRLRF
ncbi:hypothetical protein KIN20_008274 [Parelaphostrongylus tenuis]|uniref:Uncharacterized protein n=1 Tax=Parelaphostrongylus tenuis TaxID=148309 RepID=A0AAD5M9J6_PARTN|nr:hypothetical protein KIN20_008274 [Parelaphostrongylus tenuis]